MKRGFTLIELIISMCIFVIFLGIVSSSYVSIVRSQRQTNEIRKMYSEVRNFSDFLSEQIRLSEIDYECYNYDNNNLETADSCPPLYVEGASTSGETGVLLLANKNGFEKVSVRFEQDDHGNGTANIKRWIKVNKIWTEESVDNIFSGVVEIKNLSFMIFPSRNPYGNAGGKDYLNPKTQFQPMVTVYLSAANAVSTAPNFHLDYQTTISSRVYNR
jgi:prepilin-type N-terminal cleavage/methylation domain-containing protein